MISRAHEKDAPELEKLIGVEFAYKGLTKEKIRVRMKSPEIAIFKKTVAGKLIGFVELDMKNGEAFMNAVGVLDGERGKGHGSELVEYAAQFARGEGFEKIGLLVKRDNENAKKLYGKLGFRFVKYYRKVIDGSVVEVWEKPLAENKAIG